MHIKKWILGAVTVFSCAMSLSARAADLLDEIIQRGTIRVAVPTDYPPFGFVGPDMKAQGLDVDMANLIGQKLGVKVELVPVTAPNRVPYLQTGKTDLTISSLGKTAERAQVIDFSIAYAPFFDAIFGAKGNPAKTHADLAGKVIAVTRGSMQDQELQDLAPKAIVQRYEDNNSTIAAFLSGQTEFFASGTPVAAALTQRNPKLDMALKVVLANSPCYIGVRKGQPKLLAKVNDIIRDAKRSGKIDELSVRWMGAPAGDLPE
ncbi:transporter substrate-binding domain-containing protein [Bordetella genomosp. 9]|uniref:Amino acid ABC transporter substrate-binding protein n=1 Tax=Bordetella genomosp. 9 TaxID=1416803 RepID=A0A1W6Z226_9BORD|nr:transporter substrate-binding domain-containing protein [Bordetella genomosp. 9]ARP87368.1 amino acid ABC transporter substrate-binding protein [Bordetella genomosp. 9]ARP91351.1 amino acid ABC transporter substrate-binding protein [Bordetella genomosp. 9]